MEIPKLKKLLISKVPNLKQLNSKLEKNWKFWKFQIKKKILKIRKLQKKTGRYF